MTLRSIRLGLWLLVALALLTLAALLLGLRTNSLLFGAASESGNPLGGSFSLVDHRGTPVTEAILRDKPSAVFFGFTRCPEICPATLAETAQWIEALGADAEKMRFVFVTVDPERDTPAVMGDYVSAFSDRIVGVTGEPEAVHAMVKDYKVYSRKVPLEGGDYTMDHLASVLLLDDGGRLVGTIDREEPFETAVAKLRRLVAG
jgi:protein SCO1/2